MNKTDKPIARLTMRKTVSEMKQMLQLIPTEIQKIVRDYYEQFYANKLDNPEQMDKFLETCNQSRLNHEDIKQLN